MASCWIIQTGILFSLLYSVLEVESVTTTESNPLDNTQQIKVTGQVYKLGLTRLYIFPTPNGTNAPIESCGTNMHMPSGCFQVFYDYSNDSTCHPVVKVENQVAISVCTNKYQKSLTIIGSEIITTQNYLVWIALPNNEFTNHGKFTKAIFKDLDIVNEDEKALENIPFAQFHNCNLYEIINFRKINTLHFKQCRLSFRHYTNTFSNIQSLLFENSRIEKVQGAAHVTVVIQYCNSSSFYSSHIHTDNMYSLSIIIGNSISTSFVNCSFTAPIKQYWEESYLVIENDLGYESNIMLERCRVNGGIKMAINSIDVYYKVFISISNSQFTEIASNHVLSIGVPKNKANKVIITNCVFKDITSSNNILSTYRYEQSEEKGPNSNVPVVYMTNVSFRNNIGTALYTRNVGVAFKNVSFVNNTGKSCGRAVYIEMANPVFVSQTYTELNIILQDIQLKNNKNQGENGGDICIVLRPKTIARNYFNLSHVKIVKSQSTQNVLIFFDSSTQEMQKLSDTSSFQNVSNVAITTSPRYIDADRLLGSDIYPGKTIFLSGFISVTDYFHNDALCNAVPSILNNNDDDNCTIQLKESTDKIQLKTGNEVQSNVHIIATSEDCLKIKRKKIVLKLTCDWNVSMTSTLTLRECPLGYKSSSRIEPHSGPWEQPLLIITCDVVADEDNHFIKTDDSKQHIACIDRDHWYGQVNSQRVKVYCGPPYCVQDTEACPLAGYTDTHQKLPWTQDEQCSGLYGGVLCRGCQEQAVFTFGASKCISLSECKEWQPYLILCLAIVGQIVLSLVMICSRAKTTIGVGYLYGPLFFIAVYKLLPISNFYFRQTSPLEYTISLYETVLLLDLEILGKINWCMFKNLNKTLLYSMRFLGPLITFTVLLVIVLIARSSFCYKFKLNRIVQSPIQPMCLLVMLSFWSLSKTSIEIIKPIVINGKWQFSIQPEHNYLGNGYIIGLFSISVTLLACFYLPFILLLFSSQFIRRKINLYRIQPFLDAFQSSYKDKYQWFSGVYLLSWLVLNTELPSYAFAIVITGVSVLQFTLHPHKSKLLNITDTLLLADAIITSSLSYMSNQDHHAVMIIKYLLVIAPLIYILLGGIWIPLRNVVQKCRSDTQRQTTSDRETQQLVVPGDYIIDSGDIDLHENIQPQEIVIRKEMEREPLIYDEY